MGKIKQLIIIIIFILLSNQISYGQATDTSVVKRDHYKHEIGYIIPFGILYRYHVNRSAIRCIVNYKSYGDYYYYNRGHTIRTKFGAQYNFLNKKNKLFGGLDFVYAVSRDLPLNDVVNPERYTNMSVGLTPFIGFSCPVKKRFSIGLDVAAGIFHVWYLNVPDGYYTGHESDSFFTYTYLYNVILNISYHF